MSPYSLFQYCWHVPTKVLGAFVLGVALLGAGLARGQSYAQRETAKTGFDRGSPEAKFICEEFKAQSKILESMDRNSNDYAVFAPHVEYVGHLCAEYNEGGTSTVAVAMAPPLPTPPPPPTANVRLDPQAAYEVCYQAIADDYNLGGPMREKKTRRAAAAKCHAMPHPQTEHLVK
jgi:hypothetical protein